MIRRFKPQSIETLKTIMREPIYQVVMVATVGETQDIEEKFPHVKITRSSLIQPILFQRTNLS